MLNHRGRDIFGQCQYISTPSRRHPPMSDSHPAIRSAPLPARRSHPVHPLPRLSIGHRGATGVPSSPVTSGESSSGVTRLSSSLSQPRSRYGSISTLATSSNAATIDSSCGEWYEDDKMMHHDHGLDHDRQRHEENDVVVGMNMGMGAMSVENDIVEEVRLPVSTRPKGRYSLNDFSMMRTVGTGSFGRVHLGSYSYTRLSLLRVLSHLLHSPK